MKLLLGIVMGALGAGMAYAEPPNQQHSGFYFELTNKTTPFNPAAYIVSTIDFEADCPKAGYVCGIIVPYYDVYATGMYVGKPKVDINTVLLDELSDNINAALSGTADPAYFITHDRTVYLTN